MAMPEWASTAISVAVNQKLAHGKLGNFLALLSARTNFPEVAHCAELFGTGRQS
jgi:hypothetical protein